MPKLPPTDKQAAQLRKLGCRQSQIDSMSRGYAKKAISRLRAQWQNPKKLSPEQNRLLAEARNEGSPVAWNCLLKSMGMASNPGPVAGGTRIQRTRAAIARNHRDPKPW
jgi:hypothetical protein